ncbi:peptidase domain-containing ABC transporter [Caulobacter flavus]|nr:peptidase domain-containing ABC transporter [Caulobacter flavus]
MFSDFRHFRQIERAECGLMCVGIVSELLGARLDASALRRKHPVSVHGLTLRQVCEIASTWSMECRPVRCELEDLTQLALPAILHWKLDHFVVLTRVSSGRAWIVDPACGRTTVSLSELSRAFTGIAVEIRRSTNFRKRSQISPLNLLSLVQPDRRIPGSLMQTVILSVIMQAYVIATPFYIQTAVDDAGLKGDHDLLLTLALGFGLFAIFNAVAEAMRGIVLQQLTSILTWGMSRKLFRHMVRLPLPWFQRRKLADALTRFDSLTPIKSLIANGFVMSIVDGALSIVTLVMMVMFSPLLTAVAGVGIAATLVLKLALIPATLKLGAASLNASIAEQGNRIETLRSMQTIKLMAAEEEREIQWSNRLAEVVKANQANGLVNVGLTAGGRLIDALTYVALIYIATREVISGATTIGLMYAFLSYRSQFSARIQNLLDQFVNWRLLDMHTHRLADIVLQATDPLVENQAQCSASIKGHIELRSVAYGFSNDKFVLKDVNLTVEPGEFIAIIGASGMGKSTLLKVLCGLYLPTRGEVRLDGRPLSFWGAQAARRAFGVVMQDDELLSGSIAENVAFFDERIDMDRVWDCLRRASVADEIASLPMQANTLIGDMGASISSGQKQRLLVARALYREAKVLIFDEATSHLDPINEQRVSEAIAKSGVSRIVVAHRRETLASADRIYVLNDGRLVKVADRSAPASQLAAEV